MPNSRQNWSRVIGVGTVLLGLTLTWNFLADPKYRILGRTLFNLSLFGPFLIVGGLLLSRGRTTPEPAQEHRGPASFEGPLTAGLALVLVPLLLWAHVLVTNSETSGLWLGLTVFMLGLPGIALLGSGVYRAPTMKPSTKAVVIALLFAFPAFLMEPHGPLGIVWPPSADMPQAVGIQAPLFTVLGIVEALAFGLGISFLLFGYATIRDGTAASASLARAAHLSIFWLLANWWAHDSLYVHNGMNLSGLLAIDYGFHVTLILAGVLLAWFFVAVSRGMASPAARAG